MFWYSFLIFVCAAVSLRNDVSGTFMCEMKPTDVPKDWVTMVNPCTKQVKQQIHEELNAALQYLAMGAHFSRDVINRPGFAKFFFDSASEEREHAIKLMDYLLMRGENVTDIGIVNPRPAKIQWDDAISALKDALDLEAHVTVELRKIASVCENPGYEGSNFNDYHLVDWITAEYLDEQYKGQRELAGKVSELGKMMHTHGALGEFLYDKKLLTGKLVSF